MDCTWKTSKKFNKMCSKIFTWMGCKSTYRRTVRNPPRCADRFSPGWAVIAQMEGQQEMQRFTVKDPLGWAVKMHMEGR
jgi:hypothetical protein